MGPAFVKKSFSQCAKNRFIRLTALFVRLWMIYFFDRAHLYRNRFWSSLFIWTDIDHSTRVPSNWMMGLKNMWLMWLPNKIWSATKTKTKQKNRKKTFSCKETFISHTFVNDLEHEDKACGLRWIDIFVQNWVPSITRRNLQCGSAANNEVKNANKRLKRC